MKRGFFTPVDKSVVYPDCMISFCFDIEYFCFQTKHDLGLEYIFILARDAVYLLLQQSFLAQKIDL
jgi:hypothetical protein